MSKQDFESFLKDKCNIMLTDEQKKVVFTVNGPVAVIAVPGAGKTTTLICRTANLILSHKVNPSRILALSFSRASANDMEQRFSERFGGIIQEKVKFSTIHSFSYNVIRTYAFQRNIKYSIIEDNLSNINKGELLRNIYKKYNDGEWVTDDKLEEISNFIGYVKNRMITESSLEKLYVNKFPCDNFMSVYRDYESIKKQNFYIDYDDMLELCHRALVANSKLLQAYIDSYDYIEVDESQDVSKLQHEIAKLIMGKKYNVCLVGDPDQAIYSWRGAYPETLIKFRENYHLNGKVLFMSRNFRSTKNIVKVASEFIKKNRNRYGIDIFTNNDKGEEIALIDVGNNDLQAQFIIDKLKKENNLKECAVLYRNNMTSLALINKLIKEKIPFYIKDAPSVFFNHWVLRDILTIIRFANNLSNIEAFEKIYYKIKTYVKKSQVNDLYLQLSDEENVFDYLIRTSISEHLKIRYMEFLRKFTILKEAKPTECIRIIRDELNYDEFIQDFAKKYKYNMNNINIILNIVQEICENINSINDLELELKELRDNIENSKKLKGKNAVTLTTMHSAKGLEFNNVFIMDFVDGVIPTPIDSEDDEENAIHIEEERRLAYVALTRARRKVYILYPKTTNGNSNSPSMFYTEINMIISNGNTFDKKKEIENKKLNNVKRTLRAGISIKHKTYGKGCILKKEGDIIAVLFEETNKVLCLSSDTCIRGNLIELC